MSSATDSDDRLYVLAAFSMFLAAIEYVIPKPFPFMRLGLANLPILLALDIFKPRQVLLLTLYKVIGQGLIQGTLFSYIFIFSILGSFTGTLAMMCAHRFLGRLVGFVGISVFGAFAGNMARLFLARYMIFGEQVWIIAPPFLIVGLVGSILLGVFAASFSARSRWFAGVPGAGT